MDQTKRPTLDCVLHDESVTIHGNPRYLQAAGLEGKSSCRIARVFHGHTFSNIEQQFCQEVKTLLCAVHDNDLVGATLHRAVFFNVLGNRFSETRMTGGWRVEQRVSVAVQS